MTKVIIIAIFAGLSVEAGMLFTNITHEAGIHHTHSHVLDAGPAGDILYGGVRSYHWMGGGAVAEDFDGDGWIDLYVLQGGSGSNLLYMNQGDGTFVNEAAARGVDLTGFHLGAAAADYDSDGDVDIVFSEAAFVTNEISHYTYSTSRMILLRNDGSGAFTNESISGDLGPIGISSPSLGDIDNDGFLDLVVGAWEASASTPLRIWRTINGSFVPHLNLNQSWCLSPRFADINNDRYQDLLVTADFGVTRYYTNSGHGIFLLSGTSDIENGMGSAVGDIDSDGDLDWFMTSILNPGGSSEDVGITGNRMLLNDGTGSFLDATTSSGTRDGYWGWGCAFADFDCDGDLDLYHVNGWPETETAHQIELNRDFIATPSVLFENLGSNSFQEVAGSAGDADHDGQGRCVITFDYDNDGDLDLFIANNSKLYETEGGWQYDPGPPVLLRNDTPASGNWLKVSLQGTASPHHAHGIGARVYVDTGGQIQMRELNASTGFNGHGPERIAHFGVGASTNANEVRARWTNGDETISSAVPVNRHITLSSPFAGVSKRSLDPGELATFDISSEYIPTGGSAVWSYSGSTFSNSVSLSFSTSGEHRIRLDLYDGEDPPMLVRSEIITVSVAFTNIAPQSVGRRWNDETLAAIRIDFPDPTVHARNLFHSSVAMYDAWAAYTTNSIGYLYVETAEAADTASARDEAVSYAAYRVLSERYRASFNGSTTVASLGILMDRLGYDKSYTNTTGSTPAALGNRVAETVLDYYSNDGSDDLSGFLGTHYVPVNPPMAIIGHGTALTNYNRWQPLLFEEAVTQNGQVADVLQEFLGSQWGGVRPFAHATLETGFVYFDPGPPPQLGGAGDDEFKSGNLSVIGYSSLLDPDQGVMVDISPGTHGNNAPGYNDGLGHAINPVTQQPYASNVVNLADYGRVVAEFWADGPASETPPGHWNVLANEVADHPLFERRFAGAGDALPRLEWDVKMYFALNAALHDAAVAAWGCKRVYDYIRPISSIRYMGGLGQSSEPAGPSYHPLGLPLSTGLVEVITADSVTNGARHEHLSAHIDEVAVYAWAGADDIDAETEGAGCSWILAEDWMPYQKDTFVTPAFAGYVSGHSAFSRAAAEVLARLTGSDFFPGGLASFTAHRNEFLEFENGPSADVELQWASYFDAADQAGISRLYGGIHVPADDGPGRIMGAQCGINAWNLAIRYFNGSIESDPAVLEISRAGPDALELRMNTPRGVFYRIDSGTNIHSFSTWENWQRAEQSFSTHRLIPSADLVNQRFFKALKQHAAPSE